MAALNKCAAVTFYLGNAPKTAKETIINQALSLLTATMGRCLFKSNHVHVLCTRSLDALACAASRL